MKALTLIGLLVAGCLSISTIHAQPLTAQQKFDALAARGIFSGAGNAQPDADSNMDRAQFARVAALLLGLDGVASTKPATATFTDVPISHWATEELKTVAAAGYLEGNGSTTFDPQAGVTLEQLAVVMVQALGLKVDQDAAVEGTASDWAQGYIAAAVKAGVLPSADDYTQAATRSQLVASAYAGTAQQLVPDPEAPPSQAVIAQLEQILPSLTILPSSSDTDGSSSSPQSQLALADNNAGNGISIDEQMQQAVDQQMSNPMMGTYSGGFSGSYDDGTVHSVSGVLSFTGDFSGSPTMFSGSAHIETGGSGTIGLHNIGFYPGTSSFISSGSSPGTATVGSYAVTNMTVDGAFAGSTATGTWHMGLDNSGSFFDPEGSFTVTQQ